MTTGFVELDWYDTPKYYDIVFAEDTELEAAFLEAMSELYGEARNRRSLAVLWCCIAMAMPDRCPAAG